MKRRKKLTAIVIGALIGTMSCMTVMAASTCSCGYVSDMYTVIAHYARDENMTRLCQHGYNGTDSFYAHIETREYYCPEDGCGSWLEDVAVGWYWQCDEE